MTNQVQPVLMPAAELLGDARPLLTHLGSTEVLAVLAATSATLRLEQVRSARTLEQFLASYRDRILAPVELPCILHAFRHAERNQLRELVALDQRVASVAELKDFAVASCRVGQRQLSRLRPMRDQRLVRRYWNAIEAGEARGWHTLVYGVTLCIFSIPLRQGLLNYAVETLRSFVGSAAPFVGMNVSESGALQQQACAGLGERIEAMLQGVNGTPLFG